MAKKFYAVRTGYDKIEEKVIKNKLFYTWADASAVVQGITVKKHGVSVEYKSFNSEEEAIAFMEADEPYIHKKDNTYPFDALHCYVDGSYDDKIQNYSYGLVCVQQGKVAHFENGLGNNKDATAMNQIGGELLATMKALLFAKKNNYKKVVIFFDYKGIALHATGYWEAKNAFSEIYHEWMQRFFNENPDINVIFCKVDAHTGDDFNEFADGLAKLALNIEPGKRFYNFIADNGISL